MDRYSFEFRDVERHSMACRDDVWTQFCHWLSDDSLWHAQDHADRSWALLLLLIAHSGGTRLRLFCRRADATGFGLELLFLGATRAIGNVAPSERPRGQALNETLLFGSTALAVLFLAS